MKKQLIYLLTALLMTCFTSTAWAWADVAVNGKLPNAFSVSANKKVWFSQGNLQYTKSTGKWKIMDHQYDMVETLSQNVGTDYADQDVVTLFGWGTSGWESDTRTADFPYYTNSNNADYGVLATKSSTETLTDATTNGEKGDWGVFNSGDLGAGWRTLTNAEWGYLFNTRTPGNSVNGVSNARYTEATINTDGTAVNGIILFPDDADMTSVSGVTWGTINSSSSWGTQCTSAGWTALETAGCVFLPAAGRRNETSVGNVGSGGFYWSSSAFSYNASSAYFLYFYSGGVSPQSNCNRSRGCSVRLVSETAPPTMEETPLTFEAMVAGATVTYTLQGTAPIQYSTDGSTWTNYSSAITLAAVGDKVSFRGNNASYNSNDAKFNCSADCYIYGNIMSLVNATNYATATTLEAESTFAYLFSGNAHIKNHATKDLVFPATTLADKCYKYMFYECTGLTSAPALPATTLAYDCYCYMFGDCSGLTSAPVLPATTLASRCYANMFSDCTGLTTAPALPATNLEYGCYSGMFSGCNGLTSAPVLPATTLAIGCYAAMFFGCASLTSAPELPATTLVDYCYVNMFYHCTNLSSVTCYATATASDATTNWLEEVAATGTFYAPTNSVFASEERGPNAIPVGWIFTPFQSSLTTAPTAVEGLEYTGAAQALLNNDGVAEGGTLNYSLNNTDWGGAIPTATNAGDYTVYYKVVGDASHADYTPSPNTVAVTIAKVDPTYTAPTANPNTVNYDGGSKQVFWNAGSTSDGTMYYQVTTTNTQPGKSDGTWTSTWNSSITHRVDAGTYYLWYYVKGDENHLDTEVLGPVTKELQKGTRTYTKPSVNGGATTSWTGSAQTLFNAGSNTGTATLMYLVNESNTQPSKSDEGWGTSIPQKTDIGTYRLWYYLDGGDNYEDTEINSSPLSKNIVKAYPSVTAPVGKTLPYDGESHELITAGTTSLFSMEYKVGDGDWSSSIPSATAIGDYTVSYRVVPDDPEHYNTYGPSNVYAHIKAPVASITTSADVTTLYTDFNDALISAWVDGSTLKLLKAAETGSWYTLSNKGDLTLDLNGFGIKSTSSQYQYATFNLSGTTNVTIIDSNPTATHKFEKGEYDDYATLSETSGNITISGGYITGAPRSAFNVGSGSTLTMNAGTLIGNHSYYTGAAVNVSGTFTMNDGAICYNYSDQSGTGVYVESDATFKLYGGSITYNLTNGGQGAGVCTASHAHFYMHGQPEIRYNQTLYGEASNVYLHYDEYGERSNDVVIQIDGTLNQSEKYRVGIQSGFHANSGSFVFTSGLATNSGGAYDFHQFFSNDQGYYPIRQCYYDSNEAELYKGSTTLETPTTPTVNGPYTYDGSSHAMLSAPSVSNGGVVKYQYQYRKNNKSEQWESWSSWGDWYTYDALPAITDAGEYRVRAKAFADGMPGFNDSGTSSYATFTINKGQSELLTAPLGKTGLVFTGSPQDLIDSNNPGTSDHGTVVYSLTGPVNYHQEIPQGTLAGTYRVYYGVEGDYNYRGNFGVEYVDVTIAPLSVSELDNDIADFFSPYIGSSISLRIERTLLKNGYFNTLCLPFDLSASEIAASNLAGCELFVFAEAEMEENEETGEPQLRQVITPATSISAGVPYLIRWKNSGPTITELVFNEVTIQNAMGDGVDPSAIPTEGVQFLGFVPRTRIEAGNHNYLFLGQNNTLYWPANDDPGTMKGFRAYFYIPDGTTVNNAPVYHGMPARLVIRENAPTGVEYVSQEPMANSQKLIKDGILYIICGERIYNAQGQVIK